VRNNMVPDPHLLANLAILHNVNSMTEIINGLKQEGYKITPEILAVLAPYRTHHINRLGKYSIDPNRKVYLKFPRQVLNLSFSSCTFKLYYINFIFNIL